MVYNKLKNEQGVVMVTVTMIIIVLMVLTVTIMSVNVGQVKNTESEYRRIQATELAKGALVYHTAMQQTATPPASYSIPQTGFPPETLDGLDFRVNVTQQASGSCTGINETCGLSIQTTY